MRSNTSKRDGWLTVVSELWTTLSNINSILNNMNQCTTKWQKLTYQVHVYKISISQYTLLVRAYSLGPIVHISVMRLSASWCHFRQCPWEIGSAWAERVGWEGGGGGGGIRGGGWVYPKGANSMAISGFCCRKAFVGTGMAIFVLLA